MWCWFRYRALEVRSMFFFFQQARAKEKRRMVRGSSGSWPSTAQWTPVVCGCDNMASLKILKPNHGSLFTIRNQFCMYYIYIYIAHVYWPILAIITFTNHHEQIRPTLNPTNHLVLAQDGRRSELHTGPLTAPMKWGWPSSRLGWLAAKSAKNEDGVVN